MAEAKLASSSLTPQYRWNPLTLRYIKPDGQFVPFNDIQRSLNRVVSAGTTQLVNHSARLARGGSSVAEWQRSMAAELKIQHLAASSAARGGWAQMSTADKRWVAKETARQLGFLKRFAQQIADGRVPFDGRFDTRVLMYGEASAQIHKAMVARMHQQGGFRFEKNVLGVSEHSPDCLAATRRGWVSIGTLTPPGQRDCLTRCQCHLIYQRTMD